MPELPVHHLTAADGAVLAYRELGEGRPLLLIHGYLSNANTNWVRFGHAAALAARGHRVVMPDLRGHGDSDTSHDPARYPLDVLVRDGLALVDQLELADYDLGGYSLGGRTVARMLVRGARPRRAVIAGMGLDAVLAVGPGNERFRRILRGLGTFDRGSPEWMVEQFLRSNGGDPAALALVLGTATDTPTASLARIEVPVLVVVGEDDAEHESAARLAHVIPNARFETVPGNHMSAVTKPELAQVIGDFLEAPDPT